MNRVSPLLLTAVAIIAFTILTEGMLGVFFPMPLMTIGNRTSDNARLYGWGFAPYERLYNSDPDTGAIYTDIANGRGWRDVDHQMVAEPSTRRILILGDSNTFGANVVREQTYPRVLETLLRQRGASVEVISMAYGGWATDQELEALVNEGLSYRPDLVLVQFTINDLDENAHGRTAETRQSLRKPFYYQLDESETLRRHENANFHETTPTGIVHKFATAMLGRSELFKRAYVLYDRLRHERQRKPLNGYPLDARQIAQARMAFGIGPESPLDHYLQSRIGRHLDGTELSQAISASGYQRHREGLERVLSDVWLNQYWEPEHFHLKPPDPNSYPWRLYMALMRAIRARLPPTVPLLLLSDHEQGYYDWQRFWHRIAEDEETRTAFFAVNQRLADFAKNAGIEIVHAQRPHTRFRLDPHPNADGHRAMALNIADHLLRHHREFSIAP